jgi:multidrug resistance efflux pump
MNRRGIVAVCLALTAVAVGFFATRRAPAPPRPAATKPAAAPARPMVQIFAGHIEAQQTVAVDIARPGTIDGFFADVGQNVSEGQLIARLATSVTADAAASAFLSAQARKTALQSEIEQARLEAVKAKADARRASDQVAQARKVFEREQKLNEIGATPKRTLDRARDDFEAARSESDRIEEFWRQSDNRAGALEDQLRDANAALDAAAKQDAESRANLAAVEIHSPVAGTVVERKAQIGQKTGPEEGKAAFRIAVSLDRLRAVFSMESRPSPGVKPGQDVLITIPGLEIAPIRAEVSTFAGTDAVADFKSPSPAILAGMPCSVSIQLK